MVGPTWMRVHLTVGSDCLPALSQGTVLLLPSLSARACLMSDVRDLGVVLVRLVYLVIMCVVACLHGISYPMMDYHIYDWRRVLKPASADALWVSLRFHY